MNITPAGAWTDETTARLRRAGCVFAEEEAELLRTAADDDATREDLVRRRTAGEPLEHLLGWAAFDDLRVQVRPGVLSRASAPCCSPGWPRPRCAAGRGRAGRCTRVPATPRRPWSSCAAARPP